jgi:hypothetical protein
MSNQQIPSYSGVTINISNPTVNAGMGGNGCNPYYTYTPSIETSKEVQNRDVVSNPIQNQVPSTQPQNVPAELQAYPPQYYLNNYNYQQGFVPQNDKKVEENPQNQVGENINSETSNSIPNSDSEIKSQEEETPSQTINQHTIDKSQQEQDMSTSKGIINELDTLNAEEKELEKNGKKTKVVALTNEYIMSLENYLNNPNTDIRLMASKEILTRLDEDKDRFDDAALNALLNKMLQDPEKLIRIAALSAFSSRLASGNDYTVKLLTDIQNNPNSDKEDVVDAANILLQMSTDTETKYTSQPQNTQAKGAE